MIAPVAGDTVYFDINTFAWTCYVTGFIFVAVSLFEFILRNVKSGYQPDIREFKKKMLEMKKDQR